MNNNNKQINSRQRVIDHGEVYTAEREVNAMLDMVKNETERIESRFLEPACGNGNFLAEILRRKLAVVKAKYSKDIVLYEFNALLGLSSIYGIDILGDNALECRDRLFNIFADKYEALFKNSLSEECEKAVRYILSLNIIVGDALTLKKADNEPIIFSEWSPFSGEQFIRRDFSFKELMDCAPLGEGTLFSDLGDKAFTPTPIKEYTPIHYRSLANDTQL